MTQKKGNREYFHVYQVEQKYTENVQGEVEDSDFFRFLIRYGDIFKDSLPFGLPLNCSMDYEL